MSLINYANLGDFDRFKESLDNCDVIPIYIPETLINDKKYEYLELVIPKLTLNQINKILKNVIDKLDDEELLSLFNPDIVFAVSIMYGGYNYVRRYDPERIVAYICQYKIMNKNAILYAAHKNPDNIRYLLEYCIEFQEELSMHISFTIEVILAMGFRNFYKHYEYCRIFAANNDINLPDIENINYGGLYTYKSGEKIYAIEDDKLFICGKDIKIVDIESIFEPSLFLYIVSFVLIYFNISFPLMMIYIAIYITLIMIFNRSYVFNYKKFKFVNVGDKRKFYDILDTI